MAEWTAQFDVSHALARQLIEGQFPDLAPVKVEEFGVGWDNVALRVNDQYVFRFPRRKLGAELIEGEIAVMPKLAAQLPVRAPDNRFIGQGTTEFPWLFAGYELIEGRTADRAALTHAQRLAIAQPLAQFLATLHRISSDEARAMGGKADPLGRFDMPRRIKQARERIAYLAEHKLFDNIEALLAVVDSAPLNYQPRNETLVHGDLYSRHLLVDNAGALTGVIDWGDVHLGDRAEDLMIVFTLLPIDARDAFFTTYGEVEDLTLKLARFRAINHAACIVPYAHQTNDSALLTETLKGLKNAVSE